MLEFLRRTSLVKLTALAAAALGLIASAPASAQSNVNSTTVNVSANVAEVCKIESKSYVMSLATTGANINPDDAGPAQGTVGTSGSPTAGITYRCSNGTTPKFTVNGTLIAATGTIASTVPMARSGGGGSMTATLSVPTMPAQGTGMGTGQAKAFAISGSIPKTGAGGYEDAPTGAYTGSFNVDISF